MSGREGGLVESMCLPVREYLLLHNQARVKGPREAPLRLLESLCLRVLAGICGSLELLVPAGQADPSKDIYITSGKYKWPGLLWPYQMRCDRAHVRM